VLIYPRKPERIRRAYEILRPCSARRDKSPSHDACPEFLAKDGLVRAADADLAADAMSIGPQAPKEVDHRRVDLAGPLLLGPVTAAG
jgi:hypothetical protein